VTVADLPHAHAGDLAPASNSFTALARLDQAALDAFPQPVYLCAGDGRLVRFNHKAVDLWGRTPRLGDPQERFCGSVRLYRTDGTVLPHDQCPMAAALQTGESFPGQEVVIERPDGERRTVLVNIAPIRDQHERVNGAINCVQDISERKRSEDRQRHLVQELTHRVKNTLATVHSMATFTARDASSIEDFSLRFEARLVALSRAQALLSACEQEGAGLRDLLAQQLEPFGAGENARVHFEGPGVDLQPETALALCMVFHELMTNAAKYGPLSVEGGRISIKWDVQSGPQDDRTLILHWVETGGPPVKSPDRAGFGTQLIKRTIAGRGGNADLRFEPFGLQLRASLSLCNRPEPGA
jgi:two-component sensor histidine kinase